MTNLEAPEPGVVLEHPDRVEEEHEHEEDQEPGHDEGRDVEVVGVQVGDDGHRPHHAEDGGQLEEVLLGQVVPEQYPLSYILN